MSNQAPIIARTAMLAQLRASQWTARRFDKSATTELTSSKGAQEDAARVNKLLVDKEALKPIQQLVNQCRGEYYRVTLPWGDDGERILPAAKYQEFSSWMLGKYDEFDKLVDEFVDTYREQVEHARFRLGAMFDLNDYPKPSEIKSKFALSFGIRPIPTADDFRVSLSGDVEEQVKQQVRDDLDRLTKQTMHHLWEQVGQMIVSIRDRLSDPNARFKRGLLDNFVDLIGDLDALNVSNDPNLIELRREAQKHLTALRDPEGVRKDAETRRAVAQDMDELTKKFSGLWG